MIASPVRGNCVSRIKALELAGCNNTTIPE